jgi:hypothetical protein
LTRFFAVAVLLSAGGLALAAGEGSPDPSRLRDAADLFTRIERGQVVVLAKAVRTGMKATLAVEQALRGRVASGEITLAFRAVNFGRAAGTPALEIHEGERAIFVLAPRDASGAGSGKLVFLPAGGSDARIPLPAEGAEALVEAARQIVALQDADNPSTTTAELARWLAGANPWLIDIALDQVARLGLADRDVAPALLLRSRDASPMRRTKAVQAIGVALARGRLVSRGAARDPLAGEDDVIQAAWETVVRLARTDPEVEVRQAAIRELARRPTAKTTEILSAIARDDPDQTVRYEAAAAMSGAAAH